MSAHNICFHGEIRKNVNTFGLKKASYQKPCIILKFEQVSLATW